MTQEQYDRVCKEQFDHISQKLDKIHSRLFIDNGSPSIQTRLDRNERLLKVALWIVTVVCAATISQTAKNILDHFTHKQVAIK